MSDFSKTHINSLRNLLTHKLENLEDQRKWSASQKTQEEIFQDFRDSQLMQKDADGSFSTKEKQMGTEAREQKMLSADEGLEKIEKKSKVLYLSSAVRDKGIYPDAAHYRVTLDTEINQLRSVALLQYVIPMTQALKEETDLLPIIVLDVVPFNGSNVHLTESSKAFNIKDCFATIVMPDGDKTYHTASSEKALFAQSFENSKLRLKYVTISLKRLDGSLVPFQPGEENFFTLRLDWEQ